MRRKPLPQPDEYGMIEMKKPKSESELRGQRWMLGTVAGATLLLGSGLALRFTVLKDAYSAAHFGTNYMEVAPASRPTLSEEMQARDQRSGKAGQIVPGGYARAGGGGAGSQAAAPGGAAPVPIDTGVNASTYAGKGSMIYAPGAPPASSNGYGGGSASYGGASSGSTAPAPVSPYGSSGVGTAPGGYSGSAPAAGSTTNTPYSSSGTGYGSGSSAGGSGGGYGSTSGGYGSTSGSTGYGGTTGSSPGASSGGYGSTGGYSAGSGYGPR